MMDGDDGNISINTSYFGGTTAKYISKHKKKIKLKIKQILLKKEKK